MSKTIQLRFLKYDKYQYPVFIASPDEDGFEAVTDLHTKISARFPDDRPPTWQSEKYLTLKTIKYSSVKFSENCVYSLDFCLKRKDGYVNALITNAKLVKAYSHGESVEI